MGTADARVEPGDAAVAVERERQAAQRGPQPEHAGVEPGTAHGARADDVVVALEDPGAIADVVGGEQFEQRLAESRADRRGGRILL